ncbi:hypothetical protein AYI69_g1409 [Smittium culicis]|uniref:Uncharacterized protein n=1 Tax=Smittium culicis TaxID=133412 RepID=A0A1R1YQG7_9FUNG|nr:hypothetical protein AYI69_g1409 [Smittium culicis]
MDNSAKKSSINLKEPEVFLDNDEDDPVFWLRRYDLFRCLMTALMPKYQREIIKNKIDTYDEAVKAAIEEEKLDKICNYEERVIDYKDENDENGKDGTERWWNQVDTMEKRKLADEERLNKRKAAKMEMGINATDNKKFTRR